LRWDAEQRKNPSAGRAPAGGISQRDSPDLQVRNSNITPGGYRASNTHRQQWGATEPEPYTGRENMQRGPPEPQYGQTGNYAPSMTAPNYGNARREDYSMETTPNYSYDRPPVGVAQYAAQRSPDNTDPRYPSSGYPPSAPGRPLVPSGFSTTGYPQQYGGESSGLGNPSSSLGRGMGNYEYNQQGGDPRYPGGRSTYIN
jgi:hypothetical protein